MIIQCPKCKNELVLINKTYKCLNNHCYDLSKEGYVNLLMNKSFAGDNKEMVNARNDFLNKGYYSFLTDALLDKIDNHSIVLDCGCGEGYYTNKISLNKSITLYGTDVSKLAIQKAAKKDNLKKITYFVSSIYNLPVMDNSIDYILNICAPLCEDEFKRVLKENGRLIKVIPAKDHLIELKEVLYDDVYLNDDELILNNFNQLNRTNVCIKKIVEGDDIKNLFMMTPYYYKTPKEAMSKLDNLNSLEITMSFDVIEYEVINDD